MSKVNIINCLCLMLFCILFDATGFGKKTWEIFLYIFVPKVCNIIIYRKYNKKKYLN